ncbi:MAG: hypothetical protein GTO55_02660 [Armatimonadetes bacterium]|nr:hypothetical protein [Armatimonadota bacterium]NIM23181.1 hypothetical protein [Armatimonadota bacterium]NIM67049.1 hypothetical protein [Armatimonadota bacterium]NIM75583.1 hypothetical protein [Armatimonadota bacterium]NIN05238.1 hypothetical protein [Armatimonadota bacterium]
MAFKAIKTVVTLGADDLVRLQEILMDEDKEEAVAFLRDVIGEKVRCAQVETHRPEFEGGTGKEPSHYIHGDGIHSPPKKDD